MRGVFIATAVALGACVVGARANDPEAERKALAAEAEAVPETAPKPLDILAANPALRKLTRLSLHPHYAHERSFIPLRRVGPLEV